MANVHKDFHGALSYGLQFVEQNYGVSDLEDFLKGLSRTVYLPLAEGLRARGLEALREHWQSIFEMEGGDFEQEMEGDTLVLRVRRCPAICHMQQHGYTVAEHFCEQTRVVNEAVCKEAGYCSSVEYDQSAGSCVQRFWREQP